MIVSKVGNATVKNAIKIFYDLVLNDLREAEIYTDGSDSTFNSEYSTSAVVEIYRGSTLEFKGEVIEKNNTQGGGIILYCIGQEEELTETDCPVTGATHSKVWLSTGANTIFNDIVTTASGWTTDVSNSTDTSIDSFKVTDSMSCWNGIQKFLKTTNKDMIVNDSEKRIYLYDSKNRTGKATFNEGINCGNISYSEKKAKATKVIVYGKGDGDQQVIGTAGSGTPVKKIIDRAIITTAEATTRATAELAVITNSIYHYNFKCYNVLEDVEVGDTIQLNAPSVNVFNANVDVVKIGRIVVNDSESLSLQVTNTTHRAAKDKQSKEIYSALKNYETSQSAMQGNSVTNEWGTGINADSSHPAKVGFYIPSEFVNEDNNLNPVWIKVDYDIDPFNSQFGTASFSGSDPQVQNTSGDTAPDVAGSSGSTAPDVGFNSGQTEPSVTGTSATTTMITDEGSDTGTLLATSTGWNYTVCSEGASLNAMVLVYVEITTTGGTAGHVGIELEWRDSVFSKIIQYLTDDDYILIPFFVYLGELGYSDTVDLNIYNPGLAMNLALQVYDFNETHFHGDGSYAAANHLHDDGTYAAASHPHSDGSYASASHGHPDGSYDINAADLNYISIGDAVSDAASVNATGATIYLDFYNTGTSSWDNKYSVAYGSDTLKENVDVSDSGTYPDQEGYWRVRVTPNSASADFVNAKVRLKFKIDN